MAIYSHSKLSTFEQCQLKFKFKYIDKISPDFEETIEGFVGNKVHETLEWLYKEVLLGKIPELDDLISHYIEVWQKGFNESIKIIKKEFNPEHYFNRGIKFLINYFNNNFPFQDNTIAIEKKIFIKLDNEGKYIIQGYIDRLVHNQERKILEIHDYKTGNFLKTQEELDQDRQLALYALGVMNSFEDVKDIHLIWHFLDFNEVRTSKRNSEQLKKLKEDIVNLIDEIESTTEFKAKPCRLCRWCEFKSRCHNRDTDTSPFLE